MRRHICTVGDLLPGDACPPAVVWAAQYHDPLTAWKSCERGDWMLWLLARRDVARAELVQLACQCARLALPYVQAGEERPLLAIVAAEQWAAEPTAANATSAGLAGVGAARASSDARTAMAASHACRAAEEAAHTIVNADYVTEVTYHTSHACNREAWMEGLPDATQRKYVDIVRQRYPEPPKELMRMP